MEPRLGQSGVGDAVSRAAVGHGEGQSQLRTHSSCKNSHKRSTLTSELAGVGGCTYQPAWWLPGQLVCPGPGEAGRGKEGAEKGNE